MIRRRIQRCGGRPYETKVAKSTRRPFAASGFLDHTRQCENGVYRMAIKARTLTNAYPTPSTVFGFIQSG